MRPSLMAMLLFSFISVTISGCATAPTSFTVSQSSTWSTVEIRNEIDYNHAWDAVFEILVKNFEIESALRSEGYIRTGWSYTWSGEYSTNYRVRISAKFSPDRTNLQFLPEAQFLAGRNWSIGTDTRLVSTIKTDLMGTIGRTTR